MKTQRTRLALSIMTIVGTTASSLLTSASAATLSDGHYTMTINNTPYTTSYQFGSDGAWNSSFTFGTLPNRYSSVAMYDDTVASPVNGRYGGNINDGVSGSINIKVVSGVITGTGLFEFDMLPYTPGGDFVEYGDSYNFTGSIDGSGNMTLNTTGLLGAVSGFPLLVDECWNVENYDSAAPNAPNGNTAYDVFTTGSATAGLGHHQRRGL